MCSGCDIRVATRQSLNFEAEIFSDVPGHLRWDQRSRMREGHYMSVSCYSSDMDVSGSGPWTIIKVGEGKDRGALSHTGRGRSTPC